MMTNAIHVPHPHTEGFSCVLNWQLSEGMRLLVSWLDELVQWRHSFLSWAETSKRRKEKQRRGSGEGRALWEKKISMERWVISSTKCHCVESNVWAFVTEKWAIVITSPHACIKKKYSVVYTIPGQSQEDFDQAHHDRRKNSCQWILQWREKDRVQSLNTAWTREI